jgi:PAS domain S-box-containing protein
MRTSGVVREAIPLTAATARMLELTARTSGEGFFRALALGLAEVLGVRVGMVARLSTSRTELTTLAICQGGEFRGNLSYAVAGTPCADALAQGLCIFPAQVWQQFPDDRLGLEMRSESYVGIPVRDRTGDAIGVVVALHDAPTPWLADLVRDGGEVILGLFADRAALELERLEAEEQLRRSEARYRTIVSSCLEGVWTIDLEGQTTFANPQMARLLGCEVADMLGRSFFEFMDDADRELATANLRRREQGIAEHHPFRFRRRDGRELWANVSTAPLTDGHGRPVGALALVTDASEQRARAARAQQVQKLESLGVLAGGIAHDFNNLLVGILGNLEFVAEALPAGSEAHETLGSIDAAARRAAELTHQMLAYSGRGHFVTRPTNLNQVVASQRERFAAAEGGPAFHLTLDPALPEIDADPVQLGQLVMNLVTNASEAIGGVPGAITIATSVRDCDEAYLRASYVDDGLAPGRYVCLEVVDTGGGIAEAIRAKIFDPFFSTKFTGRGLGLAAVLGILRGHRGAIRVDSGPGRGARFVILLPARVGAPSAAALILVVDDDPMVRKVARRALEQAGYQVVDAVDGRTAVAALAARPDAIAAVLLDLTMPGMAGDEAFRRLRAIRPSLPVVLSSGYDEADVVARVGSGHAGFLAKPWAASELVEVIRATVAAT